ncbi:MAG TPA: transcriptional regulator [Candidatus Dormibacteraeota bacterium]|nr:transcriptional regulator [Candidatus Dormibacteraeota bacterium]
MALTPADPGAERVARQVLFDTYGALLTEHQREAVRLHLEEDWSISELAAVWSVSRAAAHDQVRRGLVRLAALEAQLGAVRRLAEAEATRQRLERRVARLEATVASLRGPAAPVAGGRRV